MARRLPTGVVIPKSTFTPDLQGLGTVDVSDIAMLWKGIMAMAPDCGNDAKLMIRNR